VQLEIVWIDDVDAAVATALRAPVTAREARAPSAADVAA